jgi:hypothetical protein
MTTPTHIMLTSSTLPRRVWLLLLLVPLEGCAAATPGPDETINLLPCGQPVDSSCDERRSNYSVLPSTRPPLVNEDGGPLSVEARNLLESGDWRPEDWRPEDAMFAEQVAGGTFGDSVRTRQYAEMGLAAYFIATGDNRGAGVDLLALVVKHGNHRGFFSAYRGLLDVLRRCPTEGALATIAVLPTELFWDHGRGRGQAKAFRARGLFEFGYYHAARVALQDPSVVEMFPAFAAECETTISDLPIGVLEESKRKQVPPWLGASFWKPHGEPVEAHQ